MPEELVHLEDGGQLAAKHALDGLLQNLLLLFPVNAHSPIQMHGGEVLEVCVQQLRIQAWVQAHLVQLAQLVLRDQRRQLLRLRQALNDVAHAVDAARHKPAGREVADEGPGLRLSVCANLVLGRGRLANGRHSLVVKACAQWRSERGRAQAQPEMPLVGRGEEREASISVQVRQQHRKERAYQHDDAVVERSTEGARQGQLVSGSSNGSKPVFVLAHAAFLLVERILGRRFKDPEDPIADHGDELCIFEVDEDLPDLAVQILRRTAVRVNEPGQGGPEAVLEQLRELQTLDHIDEGHVQHCPQRGHAVQVHRRFHGVKEDELPLRVEVEGEGAIHSPLQVHHEDHKHGCRRAGAVALYEVATSFLANEAAVLDHAE
mmetsp:Transcript_28467/g.60370  ORF Transcript_28467/g.60370 Transcript_28467/m.60370 type:complete len:377 (+) Transcript_28467:4196-5326(+)